MGSVSRIVYRDDNAVEIELVVPWELDGSGIIPPPGIEFYIAQGVSRKFRYVGSD